MTFHFTFLLILSLSETTLFCCRTTLITQTAYFSLIIQAVQRYCNLFSPLVQCRAQYGASGGQLPETAVPLVSFQFGETARTISQRIDAKLMLSSPSSFCFLLQAIVGIMNSVQCSRNTLSCFCGSLAPNKLAMIKKQLFCSQAIRYIILRLIHSSHSIITSFVSLSNWSQYSILHTASKIRNLLQVGSS